MVTIAELQAQISSLKTQLDALESSSSRMEFNFNDNFFVSDEKLETISKNENKKNGYKKMFTEGIMEMRYEINRMEKFIDNFSQRGAALMTIAGLISLLPYAVSNSPLMFLKYYLLWIFPFLAVAILAYMVSSSKRNTYRISFSIAAANNFFEELSILRNEALSTQKIWRENYLDHQKSLRWHRINNIFIQLFLFSYILNFYLFVFGDLPNNKNSIIMMVELLVVGVLIYYKNFLKSYNKKYMNRKQNIKEQMNLESGVGAVPPDILNK